MISFFPHITPIAIPPPTIFPKVTMSGSNFIVGYRHPYLNLNPVTMRELLRRPDLAHASDADPFLESVGAYAVEHPGSWSLGRARSAHDHRLQELAHASVVPLEEVLDEIAERGIVAALLREEGAALTGRQIGGGLEDRLGSVQPLVAHARLLLGLSVLSRGELRVKQRSREAPVTLHRRLGDIQDLGRFLDREAGEIAQRDERKCDVVTLA